MAPRATILAAVKGAEPDGRRALAIADHLAAEFQRHPRDEGIYLYPLASAPRLLKCNTVETMIEGAIAVKVRSGPRHFIVRPKEPSRGPRRARPRASTPIAAGGCRPRSDPKRFR